LPSGRSVCSLRIACNASRLDADGERTERANFFDVSVFGAAADSVARYLTKGSRIGVDGRLEWREWETSDGQRRQSVGVVADVVQFLDTPTSGRDADGEDEQLAGGAGGEDGELLAVGAGDLEVTF
jgi:single-strand DNA-binding protein